MNGTHELGIDRRTVGRLAAEARVPARRARAPRLGVLRVVSGRADHPEYHLDAQTSFIGRADSALVRLHGWLRPTVAVKIARVGDGYVATPVGGRPRLNDEPLSGRRRLQDGDLLQVSGLTLEFGWKGRARTASSTSSRASAESERAE